MKKPVSRLGLHNSLIEAAETERRLPAALPRKSLTFWPDTSKPEWLAYAPEKTEQKLEPATARQVTDYESILVAIAKLPTADMRRTLWTVAHSAAFRTRGPNWKQIAARLHKDRRTSKRIYQEYLFNFFCIYPFT